MSLMIPRAKLHRQVAKCCRRSSRPRFFGHSALLCRVARPARGPACLWRERPEVAGWSRVRW